MGSLSAKCSACGTPLAVSHVGPCPKCGNNRKMYDKGLEEAFLRFRGNLSWRRLREYYEQRPFLLAIVLVATVASPFIGFLTSEWEGVWFGLAVSVLTFILGARAITKVRDTERGD